MGFWQWAFGRGVLDLVSFWLWAFGFGGLLVVGFWWWAFGGEHIFGGQIALLQKIGPIFFMIRLYDLVNSCTGGELVSLVDYNSS